MTKRNFTITVTTKQQGGRSFSRTILESKDGALKCLKGAYAVASSLFKEPYVVLSNDENKAIERIG